MLLPGSLCDARLFGPQIAALRHRAVSVGNIGGADSISTIATDILRRAPHRFALAGLSMGGIVALEIWRQAPERVAGLALLGTSFAPETPAVAARRAEEVEAVKQGGTAALRRLVRDTYLPRYFAGRNRDDPRLGDLVLQMAAACGPSVMFRQWNALACRPDSRATLATIDCPALVLCGAEDRLCTPAVHEELASRIRVPCHVIDGCGHLATVEAPRETTALMAAWLQAVDAHEQAMQDGRRDVAC
jgi:pimeloyl-ACP methyl ester carboxylesterase